MKTRIRTALLATLGTLLLLCLALLAACKDKDHTHEFSDWQTVTPATCTEKGEEKRTCSCGEEETREIPALGHDLQVISSTATCTEPGTETVKCSRCTYQTTNQVPAKGHTREKLVRPVRAAKCETDGEEIALCSVCGQEYHNIIPALGHNWQIQSVLEEATCTEAGIASGQCKNCQKESDAIEIPALGHDYETTYTIDTPATFEAAGSRSKHCTRCDAKTDVSEIPKLEEGTPIQYIFRLVRTNGDLIPFADIEGTVYDGSSEIGKLTFRNGKANAALAPKSYTVRLTKVPDGYTAQAEYTVSYQNPTCNLTLTGALRTGTAPEKVSYSKCSVMYDFSYTTLATNAQTSQTIRLSTLLTTYKAVVLNFWDTQCTFCEYEFPGMEAAYQKYKNDIAIIAVCDGSLRNMEEDSEADIVAYANSHRLSFYIVSDYEGLGTKFGLSGNPSTVVIDREGVVSEIHAGALVNRNDYEDVEYSQAQFEAIFAKYAPTAATSLPALLPARKR